MPPVQSPEVEIYCEVADWHDVARDLDQRIKQAALATFSKAGKMSERRCLTILLTDDEQLRALNRSHRGKDRPTNVLSFPAVAGSDYLGDIAIAFGTARRESEETGEPFMNHVLHLVVHGVLHLLKFDHETTQEAEVMEAMEVEVLARMGVPDPYRQQYQIA